MKGTEVGETSPMVCQVGLTIAALLACIRILALNGANIFDVGRLVCLSSLAILRRFATVFSSWPASKPRDILQLYGCYYAASMMATMNIKRDIISPMIYHGKDFSDLMHFEV